MLTIQRRPVSLVSWGAELLRQFLRRVFGGAEFKAAFLEFHQMHELENL